MLDFHGQDQYPNWLIFLQLALFIWFVQDFANNSPAKEKLLHNNLLKSKIQNHVSFRRILTQSMGVSWNSITSGNIGKQVVGDDWGHVKTIIKMLAANNADYTPARVALAA